LLVTNVFGISPLLVWREMTLEEAQISDTHSLKDVGDDNWAIFTHFQVKFLRNMASEIIIFFQIRSTTLKEVASTISGTACGFLVFVEILNYKCSKTYFI
jgi:hypothetical protein